MLGYEIDGNVCTYVACTWMYMLGPVADRTKWEEERPLHSGLPGPRIAPYVTTLDHQNLWPMGSDLP